MITRIKPPKYKLGRYSLNEYELRQLMLEVAKGEKQAGQYIKDEKKLYNHYSKRRFVILQSFWDGYYSTFYP